MFNIKHFVGTLLFIYLFIFKKKKKKKIWYGKANFKNTIDCKLLNMLPLILIF